MNLFQMQEKTSGYDIIPNAIATDDETTPVPFGSTILLQTTTTMIMDHRSKRRMVSIVVGMMMMLMVNKHTIV